MECRIITRVRRGRRSGDVGTGVGSSLEDIVGKEEKFLPPPAINCDLWSAPTLYSKINKSDRALSLFDFACLN
jgi:hypothetical protein